MLLTWLTGVSRRGGIAAGVKPHVHLPLAPCQNFDLPGCDVLNRSLLRIGTAGFTTIAPPTIVHDLSLTTCVATNGAKVIRSGG